MATFKVSWRLCVNDHAVPVESVSLPWMDPLELTSDLDLDEEIAVNLVNLKATALQQAAKATAPRRRAGVLQQR